jgi:hypothetical protein
MRVLQLLGVLLFMPSALAFYHLWTKLGLPIGLSDGTEHVCWLGFRALCHGDVVE